MQEDYKILGVSQDATDEEVDAAYKSLKAKYSSERFAEGEEGNRAARNLTKLETAYTEIITERAHSKNQSTNTYDFSEVEQLIKSGSISAAQEKLDDYTDRNAEWHYLQSVIFYKKNWTNESKKQLEIAMSMEPTNSKYADAYGKLKQKMDFADKQFNSGNAGGNANSTGNAGAGGNADPNKQMGGDACSTMSDCCAAYCCSQMLCNCLCR